MAPMYQKGNFYGGLYKPKRGNYEHRLFYENVVYGEFLSFRV